MPLSEVRRSAERPPTWRAERWHDGWRLFLHGGLVLSRATEAQAAEFMAQFDARWDALVVD